MKYFTSILIGTKESNYYSYKYNPTKLGDKTKDFVPLYTYIEIRL